MFCPNCGTDNKEGMTFCRSCGEYLKIISQAMKRSLPVSFVSKLDSTIELESERWRRDAIFGILGGTIGIILIVFLNSSFGILGSLIILLFVITYYRSGIRSYLAYRRVLDLNEKSLHAGAGAASLLPDASADEAAVPVSGESPRKNARELDTWAGFLALYCPGCGQQNTSEENYCRTCGIALKFENGPQGIERYLPESYLKFLDEQIIKNRGQTPPYKTGWTVLFVAAFFLFYAVSSGLAGEWGWMTINIFVFLSTVITTGWELIVYRRKKNPGEHLVARRRSDVTDQGSFATATYPVLFLIACLVLAVSYVSTFLFDAAFVGIPMAVITLIVVIALLLRFQDKRREKQTKDLQSLPTEELPIGFVPEANTIISEYEDTRQLHPTTAFAEIDSAPENVETRKLADVPGEQLETKTLTTAADQDSEIEKLK